MKKGGVDYISSALYGINEVVKKIKSIDWGSTKLVRILNEYEDEKELICGKRNYKWYYDEENDSVYAERIDGSELGEEESWAVIICRGYCFIWRLVENHKIDLDKTDDYYWEEGLKPINFGKYLDNRFGQNYDYRLLFLIDVLL